MLVIDVYVLCVSGSVASTVSCGDRDPVFADVIESVGDFSAVSFCVVVEVPFVRDSAYASGAVRFELE